jgi:hypothetical protein
LAEGTGVGLDEQEGRGVGGEGKPWVSHQNHPSPGTGDRKPTSGNFLPPHPGLDSILFV